MTEKPAGPLPERHVRILAQRLYDGQLSLFVGAGISHLAPARDGSDRRLPLWKELAERVAVACNENFDDYDRKPLELFDAIAELQSRGDLEEAVRKSLDDTDFEPSAVHTSLAELPWAAVLTTNYDGLLSRVLDTEPVEDEDGYDRVRLRSSEARLFHVHGTLARPHTLTRGDYRLWDLDGLDQIRDPHQRLRFREELDVLARQRQGKGDRWVVTTRRAGEPSAGLGPGWKRAEMPALRRCWPDCRTRSGSFNEPPPIRFQAG